MKKIYGILILIIIILLIFILIKNNYFTTSPIVSPDNQSGAKNNQPAASFTRPAENPDIFTPPLTRAAERVTKKYFGMYITPGNSPLSPERFTGYHTGTDFEIFPNELDIAVAVRAICDGVLKLKEYAGGYGGLAVEACELKGEPITVIYGHLKLLSISAENGDSLKTGDVIGILGADQSQETDYERKHLHLGIHKGTEINIRGYVATEAETENWLDPCQYVCGS